MVDDIISRSCLGWEARKGNNGYIISEQSLLERRPQFFHYFLRWEVFRYSFRLMWLCGLPMNIYLWMEKPEVLLRKQMIWFPYRSS